MLCPIAACLKASSPCSASTRAFPEVGAPGARGPGSRVAPGDREPPPPPLGDPVPPGGGPPPGVARGEGLLVRAPPQRGLPAGFSRGQQGGDPGPALAPRRIV